MITDKFINVNLVTSPTLLQHFYIIRRRVEMSSFLQANQFCFYTFLVFGSESDHSRVTVYFYNDPQGNSSWMGCRKMKS